MPPSKRILIVDDEEQNRELLEALLDSLGHASEKARDGFEALAKLKLSIDLVLLDVMMPGMDGFEVARRIREDPVDGNVPIIMVTALEGKESRLRAVEVGANDFISKPIDLTELKVRTASMLKMKEAQDAVNEHQAKLEEMVEQRTAALRKALEDMAEARRKTQEAHLDTIRRLSIAAEYKDEDTAVHIHRMSKYSALLAKGLNLPPSETEIILHASPLHDIGKIGIADSILLKPGKLNDAEWKIMKAHTTIGGRILSGSASKLLQAGEIIACSHHEKWDGSGYPKGLAGETIPIWGRICGVTDVFDALTSNRPYKQAFSNEKALDIMQKGRGRHFDPKVLDVFLECWDDLLAIQKECHNCPDSSRQTNSPFGINGATDDLS
jgi:putative two-component system response regulator